VQCIERAANFRANRLLRKWAGLRSFVADKSPVIGFDSKVDRFFWLVAQGGYGIQTSPALGRVAAALACGKDMPEDLKRLGITPASLSPRRLQS
jgi:D-arginine dehydrogenase